MAMGFGKATTTVSGSFIWHVRLTFERAVEDAVQKGQTVAPRFVSPAVALPTYVIAVSAVEAMLNEFFLSDSPKLTWGIIPPPSYDPKKVERLPTMTKLHTLPQLFFGATLGQHTSPLREMHALVAVRNELVHYKFGMKPPSGLRLMAKQGAVAPVPPEQEAGGPQPWADRVSTLEGILWAHDTASRTVRAVIALAPEECHPRLVPFTGNFNAYYESKLREFAQARGVELPSFPWSSAD